MCIKLLKVRHPAIHYLLGLGRSYSEFNVSLYSFGPISYMCDCVYAANFREW